MLHVDRLLISAAQLTSADKCWYFDIDSSVIDQQVLPWLFLRHLNSCSGVLLMVMMKTIERCASFASAIRMIFLVGLGFLIFFQTVIALYSFHRQGRNMCSTEYSTFQKWLFYEWNSLAYVNIMMVYPSESLIPF